MRSMMFLSFATAALLGACASSKNASGNACIDRCASRSGLERSSCELDCSRVATTTPPTTSHPPPQQPAPPKVEPLPPQQPAPQPLPPQPPGTQPRPQPAPQPQPQPVGQPSATNYSFPPGGGSPTATPSTPTYAYPPGTPPTYAYPPGGTPTGGAPQPAPADRQAIASCEYNCMQENQSATDQTTCKLNCNAVGTVLTPPSSYNVYAGAPPSDADTRAAVIRSSGGVVPGSAQPRPTTPTAQPSAPPAATPERVAQCAAQAQQCANSCGVQLAPCNQSCDQGKMSSTDRATCKLTCETNVDVCRDDCRIKEGTCRGPVYKP